MALGVSLAENLGLGGGGQVGVKNYQIVSALLGQPVTPEDAEEQPEDADKPTDDDDGRAE